MDEGGGKPTENGDTPTKKIKTAGGSEPVVDQKVALNGAQVTSLLEVINSVAVGQLPRESAVQIISVAFNIDRALAESILGTVGKTFKPSDPDPKPADPAATADAP